MCVSWLKVQAIKKYCRGVLHMGMNVKRACCAACISELAAAALCDGRHLRDTSECEAYRYQ
jgi:hypothetical protein